jgi:hypothetical protein
VPGVDEFIDELRRSAPPGHARVFASSYDGGVWLGTGLAAFLRRRGWPVPPCRHGRLHERIQVLTAIPFSSPLFSIYSTYLALATVPSLACTVVVYCACYAMLMPLLSLLLLCSLLD